MHPLFVLSFLACTGGETTTKWSESVDVTGGDDTADGGFDAAATVMLDSYDPEPADGEGGWYEWDVAGGLTASWSTLGLTVAEPGGDDVTGEGHFAVYIGGGSISETEPVAVTTDTSYTIDGSLLVHGDYWITVAVMDNSGDLLQVYDSKTIEIRRPTVSLPRLADGMSVDSVTELTIDSSAFSLDSDNIGGENVFTTGHYVVTLDGASTDVTEDVYAWPEPLTPGPHSISVELVQNDGSAFEVPQIAEVDVVVPTLTPVDATDGAEWASASLPVSAESTDVTIDEAAIGGDHVAGTGHYRLYVNDVYTTSFGADGSYALNLPEGMHSFELRLANNDETEVGVNASWTATIMAGRPDVVLTLPTGTLDTETEIVLSVSAENFTFDEANVGGANEVGFGHYHVTIDGEYFNFGATNELSLGQLAVGEHEIMVTLQQNDHSDLDPMVLDMGTITIEEVVEEETQDTGA